MKGTEQLFRYCIFFCNIFTAVSATPQIRIFYCEYNKVPGNPSAIFDRVDESGFYQPYLKYQAGKYIINNQKQEEKIYGNKSRRHEHYC